MSSRSRVTIRPAPDEGYNMYFLLQALLEFCAHSRGKEEKNLMMCSCCFSISVGRYKYSKSRITYFQQFGILYLKITGFVVPPEPPTNPQAWNRDNDTRPFDTAC